MQGIAGCFGMIQEIPDQFDILVGNPFAAVLFADSGAYGDASLDGGKTLQPVVIDNGEQVEVTFGTSFVHCFHDGLAQSFL